MTLNDRLTEFITSRTDDIHSPDAKEEQIRYADLVKALSLTHENQNILDKYLSYIEEKYQKYYQSGLKDAVNLFYNHL